ncbi:hypothetical protein KIL84_017088 [Mauremys mutica]|uniref:Uncharacterized protein n=1 Tax=Mauremys mutica TaxID=74926 RepID=A0A9D4AX36_9SAUR|nr:hypothetical protein KIL84_017088 [Mauremys mutica]
MYTPCQQHGRHWYQEDHAHVWGSYDGCYIPQTFQLCGHAHFQRIPGERRGRETWDKRGREAACRGCWAPLMWNCSLEKLASLEPMLRQSTFWLGWQRCPPLACRGALPCVPWLDRALVLRPHGTTWGHCTRGLQQVLRCQGDGRLLKLLG